MSLQKNSHYKLNLNFVHNPYYIISKIYKNLPDIKYGEEFSMTVSVDSPLMNHTDAKILWYLLHKIQMAREGDRDAVELHLSSMYSICRDLGITDSGENYTRIEEALHKFLKVVYSFGAFYKNKRYMRVSLNLVTKVVLNDKSNEISITFNKDFIEMNENTYSRIFSLPFMLSLSPSAARLYEVLESSLYNEREAWKISADKLVDKLCIDGRYPSKTKALISASVNEINSHLEEYEINRKYFFSVDENNIVTFIKE